MDQTETGIRGVIKALTDTIAPAVDRTDPLAQEQLRLCVDYLEFLCSRLDHLHARARFELADAASLARAASQAVKIDDPVLWRDLTCTVSRADRILADPGAGTTMVKDCTMDLCAVVRDLVRALAGDTAAAHEIGELVIEHSRAQVEFERSWYGPMGFDPAPATATPFEAFLQR